jgi:predicted lipid-binding transport protein (Tim44 family)
MKDAAQGFAKDNVSPKIRPALGGSSLQPQLMAVAAAFVELQQARHEADYDTSRRFTRQECLDLLDQAEQAFADWRAVRQTLQADTFLVALLAQRYMRA